MKKLIQIILTCLTVLFVSCSSMPMKSVENVEKGVALEKNWGYVIARVINPDAGKTIPAYNLDGEVTEYIKLNSDVTFENKYRVFGSGKFVNDEAPVQLYFCKIKKGSYYVSQVGTTSVYKPAYFFNVKEGKINYIGDFYIDLVHGGLITLKFGHDWYDLTVKDNFSDLTGFEPYLSEYKEYELVNSSSEYKKKPWICPVDRSYVTPNTASQNTAK